MMIIAGALLIVSGSCSQMVKMRYGVREPREESPATISAFMDKMRQPDSTCFTFRDSASYCRFLKDPVLRKDLLGSFIFNSRGLVINYKDTAKCRWSATTFIRNLRGDTTYQVDTSYRFGELYRQIKPLVASSSGEVDERGCDFVIVITWAVYAGKLNERLFDADEAASENPRIRARVLFLNTDMQKEWKLRPDQKLVIR